MATSKGENPLNGRNPGWQADSRPKLQAPESSQASSPAALRWRGPLPPLFPPWSPRTASLADQVHWAAFLPGSWAADLKAMCESLRSFHMKHSGTGSRTRREACPNGAEQTWIRWFRMCPHKIDSAPGKANTCYPMLPASFCISGVCWIETSYVTAALANIGMQ